MKLRTRHKYLIYGFLLGEVIHFLYNQYYLLHQMESFLSLISQALQHA